MNLILMPAFGSEKPHLGIACLSAYLKKEGLGLDFTDFRNLYNCEHPFSYTGRRSVNYVPEAPDLPLLLAIIRNYNQGKKLTRDIYGVLKEYAGNQRSKYLFLKNDINRIYAAMEVNIDRLTKGGIVGFSTYQTNFFYTFMFSLLMRQRKPGVFIIYGGPHVSLHLNAARLALKSGAADRVVVGEGESALATIIKSLDRAQIPAIPGVMSYDRRNDSFNYQAGRGEDLDRLPCPDFSVFETGEYALFRLPLYASRGCVFRCVFCNEWKQFYPFRQLGYAAVVERMKYLHQRYGTIRFDFSDSLLNSSPDWLEGFADELLKEGLNLQWGGFFRGEMSEERLKKLKASGLSFAFIGIESFSRRLLVHMDKRRSVDDNFKSIELFCSLRIPTVMGIIIGFPGSTESDFKRTLHVLVCLMKKYPDSLQISVEPFRLSPLSRIDNNLRSYGISLIGWDARVTRMVPELSDIAEKIPATVCANPAPRDIRKRLKELHSALKKISHVQFSFQENKNFRQRMLRSIRPSHRIRIPKNSYRLIPLTLPSSPKEDAFLLKWSGFRYPLTGTERVMLENFDAGSSLSQISRRMARNFNQRPEECYRSLLKFLADLAEINFVFDVLQ